MVTEVARASRAFSMSSLTAETGEVRREVEVM